MIGKAIGELHTMFFIRVFVFKLAAKVVLRSVCFVTHADDVRAVAQKSGAFSEFLDGRYI